MKQENKQFLLKLARQTLENYYLTGNKIFLTNTELLDSELKNKRGTFVTLSIKGELRGCIGHLEPVQEIYQDIIDNVLSAAFADNRFLPLREDELKNLSIEISILTKPEKLVYFSIAELLNKIIPFKQGIIIKKDNNSATYLPQVWEQIPDKTEFLSSLCRKAGLLANEWKKGDLEVWVYEVEVFSE